MGLCYKKVGNNLNLISCLFVAPSPVIKPENDYRDKNNHISKCNR